MSNLKNQAVSEPATAGRLGLAVMLAAAVLSASAAQATDETPGLRVAKDPVTGKLRAPTAQESAALDAKAALSASRGLRTGKTNPPAIHHPGGAVEQELTEASLVYSVAKRNPDGSISWVCVTGPEAASAALDYKTTTPVSTAGKEHNHDR